MNPDLRILLAEDNEDDLALLEHALRRAEIPNPLHACRDGRQVIEYLQGKGVYSDRATYPFPRMLILDLKMPNLNGFEVLRWLKEHPECSVLPIIIFTSSKEPRDIHEAYRLGANAYFAKPADPRDTQNLFKALHAFWNFAELPDLPGKC